LNTEELVKTLKKGIIEENSLFVLVLGLCPALAVTTNLYNGIAMGLSFILVISLSVTVCSLIKNFIPQTYKIPVYLAIIAIFVTVVDLTLKAYFPGLSKNLGIFTALIVVNCIILGRIEAFAEKNPPTKSLTDGLGIGVGFLLALILIGGIRELLGSWKLFGFSIPVSFQPMESMLLSPGGFITVGILMGLFAWYKKRIVESHLLEVKGNINNGTS
jgi:electron transport complex protein RnfE